MLGMRYHGVRSWHQGLLQKIGRYSSEDWKWVCATVAIFSLFIEPPFLQSNVLSRRYQLIAGKRTPASRICLWLWSWSPKVVTFWGHELASASFLAKKGFPWRSLVEIFRLAYRWYYWGYWSHDLYSAGYQRRRTRSAKNSKSVTPIQVGHNA